LSQTVGRSGIDLSRLFSVSIFYPAGFPVERLGGVGDRGMGRVVTFMLSRVQFALARILFVKICILY
jgi:hypothetical protein